MTRRNAHSSTSSASRTTRPQLFGRLRKAVQLFIGRSQLGPVNNYCRGDHGAA